MQVNDIVRYKGGTETFTVTEVDPDYVWSDRGPNGAIRTDVSSAPGSLNDGWRPAYMFEVVNPLGTTLTGGMDQ